MNEKFFLLLRMAVGSSEETPEAMTDKEWTAVYQTAERQALVGVMFRAVEALPAQLRPSLQLKLNWYARKEQIAAMNRKLNEEAVATTTYFLEHGLRSCILKGQGNAMMYPDPLSRNPGDIDIWVEGGKERVLRFLDEQGLHGSYTYHHIHLHDRNGVEVEVHFRPASGNYNPLTNRRLQRWLTEAGEAQFTNETRLPGTDGTICVPTMAFNRIHQMDHMQRHLISSGLGLRQVMDYYYLLQQPFADDGQEERLLRRFGLYRFARAMMHVLHHYMGLDRRYLSVEPDPKLGQLLMQEILTGGNFGQHFGLNPAEAFFRYHADHLRRLLRLARLAPSEVVWEELWHVRRFLTTIPQRIRNGKLTLKETER